MNKQLLAAAIVAAGAFGATAVDISLRQEADRAIANGLDYLAQQQEPDGSWRKHPAITGLAVLAFAQMPGGLTPDAEKRIAAHRPLPQLLDRHLPDHARDAQPT